MGVQKGNQSAKIDYGKGNISTMMVRQHTKTMREWYDRTLGMLMNKQDHAVEAVKLEWLLKRTKIGPTKRPFLRKSALHLSEESLNVLSVERRSSSRLPLPTSATPSEVTSASIAELEADSEGTDEEEPKHHRRGRSTDGKMPARARAKSASSRRPPWKLVHQQRRLYDLLNY